MRNVEKLAREIVTGCPHAGLRQAIGQSSAVIRRAIQMEKQKAMPRAIFVAGLERSLSGALCHECGAPKDAA